VTIDDQSALAEEFEAHRGRLRLLAVRLLGSSDEADDVVQETWIRLSQTAAGGGTSIANLGGWLTTVASRVCIDAMRRRGARPGVGIGDRPEIESNEQGPAELVLVAETVTAALLAVLDRLSPPERVAFVLHDTFAVPFAAVAAVLEVTPAAARQLASRGRRKVRNRPSGIDGDTARARAVVSAFLSAARCGDLDGLLAVLHPDADLTMDAATAAIGATPASGAVEVAAWFDGRAAAARLVLLDGAPGLAWWAGGRLRVVFHISVLGSRITRLQLIGDKDCLTRAEVVPL